MNMTLDQLRRERAIRELDIPLENIIDEEWNDEYNTDEVEETE